MNIPKSTIEGASLATEMTKRELIAMHILAAYCTIENDDDDDDGRGSFMELADNAVLQTEALLRTLHDDPDPEE